MTKILIISAPGCYDITVQGHAEKVNDGEGNILCAAVSMLAQTLLQRIRDLEKEHLLRHKERITDGFVRIVCQYDENNERVKATLGTIETGFLLLQASYEKKICVVGETGF